MRFRLHINQKKLLMCGPTKPFGESITALTVTPCGDVAILDPSDLQGKVTSVSVPAKTNA